MHRKQQTTGRDALVASIASISSLGITFPRETMAPCRAVIARNATIFDYSACVRVPVARIVTSLRASYMRTADSRFGITPCMHWPPLPPPRAPVSGLDRNANKVASEGKLLNTRTRLNNDHAAAYSRVLRIHLRNSS